MLYILLYDWINKTIWIIIFPFIFYCWITPHPLPSPCKVNHINFLMDSFSHFSLIHTHRHTQNAEKHIHNLRKDKTVLKL